MPPTRMRLRLRRLRRRVRRTLRCVVLRAVRLPALLAPPRLISLPPKIYPGATHFKRDSCCAYIASIILYSSTSRVGVWFLDAGFSADSEWARALFVDHARNPTKSARAAMGKAIPLPYPNHVHHSTTAHTNQGRGHQSRRNRMYSRRPSVAPRYRPRRRCAGLASSS